MDDVDPCLLYPERPRNDERTIDLSLLGQPRPMAHVVDSGDVLGIYIEGVLGEEQNGPPVVSPSLGASPQALTTATVAAASLGYPIPVRADGSIALPYRPAIPVRGMTVEQVEAHIRSVYSGPGGLLKSGRDRIFVTLHKPRTVRVLVVRKDRPQEPAYLQPPDYRRADEGRGTAVLVELPAFENDVLHALVASGGLPGPDAEEAVYVMRAGYGAGACANQPLPAPAPMQTYPAYSANRGHDLPAPATMQPTGIQQVAGRVVATMPVPETWSSPTMLMNQPMNAAPIWADTLAMRAPQAVPFPLTASGNVGGSDPFASTRSNGQISSTGQTNSGSAVPANSPFATSSRLQASSLSQASSVAQVGYRKELRQAQRAADQRACMPQCCGVTGYQDATVASPAVRKIPLSMLPGEAPQFATPDVLLSNGDIVFIESRSREYFYTAGLLGGGKYPLPRNEDTDLLDAIALADSQRRVLPTRQVGGVSSLNQDVTIGASKVIIFREDSAGQTVPIKVDLNKLKRNPANAPVIMPDDRIVLQYTKLEAFAAAFERHFLEGTVLGVASGITFGNN